MARIAAAMVALIAWFALAIQFSATLTQAHSIATTVWILLRFFTILTNLLVAVVMTMTAIGRPPRPFILAGTTLAMLLVGVVYFTLLRGTLQLSGRELVADALLHKLTPLASAGWWLAFAPKGRLGWRMPAAWAVYPLLYLVYALFRGHAERAYPYAFIDVGKLGWAPVALNAAMIALAFLIAGLGLVALDQRIGHGRA